MPRRSRRRERAVRPGFGLSRADRSTCSCQPLFLRPTGLADGLALKECATAAADSPPGHDSRPRSWFPRSCRREGTIRQVQLSDPYPTGYGIKHYWVGRSLSCLAELAGALQVLADLAHMAGGAVCTLGDHAVGLVGAAAELELEQRLAPGGPAVRAGADGGLLDRLLALAMQAEPVAAALGPALGPARGGLVACGVADRHLAAGTGPAAGARACGRGLCLRSHRVPSAGR